MLSGCLNQGANVVVLLLEASFRIPLVLPSPVETFLSKLLWEEFLFLDDASCHRALFKPLEGPKAERGSRAAERKGVTR